MPELNYCPCCGRHCDLREPRCGRGREYLRTMGAEGEPDLTEQAPVRPDRRRDYEQMGMDEKLNANLRDVAHTLHSLHDGRGSQGRVLTLLLETGGMTQRELTRCMGIQPGSASEVIGKLENADLIRRTPSPTDLRTADISLTETGKARAEQVAEQRKTRRGEMFSCLTEEEKTALLALLEKLNKGWEAYRRDDDHSGAGRGCRQFRGERDHDGREHGEEGHGRRGHGERGHDGEDHGRRDRGERGHDEEGHGRRDHGERGHDEKGHGRRDHGEKGHDEEGHGGRGYGEETHGKRDHGGHH